MNIEQLKKYWEDNDETLYTYSPSQVDRTKVDNETFIFLTTCGLPSDASPFLSFGLIQTDKLLTPNQVFEINIKSLNNYLMLGSTGSSDPICVDTIEGKQVVYLNHDNDFKRVFMNSNIFHLAVCLTKYRDFLFSLVDFTKEDFSKKKFTDSEYDSLRNDFITVDSNCLSGDSFWKAELDNLLWERNNK